MAIIDIFSKRKRRQESQDKPHVYQYENLPEAFRVQVVHIWRSALGRRYRDRSSYSYSSSPDSPSSIFWEELHDLLAREKGMWNLGDRGKNPQAQCIEYLMGADTDSAPDIIELSFKVIDRAVRKFDAYDRREAQVTQWPDDAIEELNGRFSSLRVTRQRNRAQLPFSL